MGEGVPEKKTKGEGNPYYQASFLFGGFKTAYKLVLLSGWAWLVHCGLETSSLVGLGLCNIEWVPSLNLRWIYCIQITTTLCLLA